MAKRPSPDAPAGKTLNASCRVALLHGEEAFLRVLYTGQLREALTKEFGAGDVVTFDGASAQAADVLDECRSFGLIAAHKLVVLDNADALVRGDENRALFERYAEHPSDGATLLFRAQTWRAGRLDKLIDAAGCIIKCDPLPEAKAAAWAAQRCKKQHNAQIEPDAAALLVERTGSDLGRIDSELGKLAAASPAKPITRDLVVQFVGMSREEEAWSLQGRLLGVGPEEALHAMRSALDVSRTAPQLGLYMCMDLARKLHAASALLARGGNPFQVSKALRLWGPAGDALLAAARTMRPSRALALLEESVEFDTRNKTGLSDPGLALERLAIRFAEATGGG